MIALVGCRSKPEPQKDTCSIEALGLGSAKPMTAWQAPAGCTVRPATEPLMVRTEIHGKAQFECPEGTVLGIDWKHETVVVSTKSWSPAQVGVAAFDDGAKITLVDRQRSPCPGDPQPMPSAPVTSLFLGKAGKRTFAHAVCTVPTSCP